MTDHPEPQCSLRVPPFTYTASVERELVLSDYGLGDNFFKRARDGINPHGE